MTKARTKPPGNGGTKSTRTKLTTSRPGSSVKASDIWPPVTESELKLCQPEPVIRAIYRLPGDSGWFRGTKDAHRFYARSQREIKQNLGVINNRHFSTAGDTIMVTGATPWQFIFGRDNKGAGGKGGPGGGGTNSNDGVEVEVDVKDHPLFKDLELPNLERKKTARTEVLGVRMAGLDKTGTRSDWARKDSMRNMIKRTAATTDPQHMPDDGELLVPDDAFFARRDNRYWTYDETRQPIIEATVYLLTDKSASMGPSEFELIYLFNYCAITFLRMNYKFINIVILGHTHEQPIEYASWEAMTKDRTTGGTMISPSLRWIREHARVNYPPQKVNCYLIQGGDGDNSESDVADCRPAYMDLINDGFNHIVWMETSPGKSTTGFYVAGDSKQTELFKKLAAAHPRLFHWGILKNRESVFLEFRRAYKRGGSKPST
jgi:uncharacterized sporulation protein YeaH/YhbH (DUF444 family)